jgi:hypothetical protein
MATKKTNNRVGVDFLVIRTIVSWQEKIWSAEGRSEEEIKLLQEKMWEELEGD